MVKSVFSNLFEEDEVVHLIGLDHGNGNQIHTVFYINRIYDLVLIGVLDNVYIVRSFHFIFRIHSHTDLFPHGTFDSFCEVDGDLLLVLIASNTDAWGYFLVCIAK